MIIFCRSTTILLTIDIVEMLQHVTMKEKSKGIIEYFRTVFIISL
jgi:hypothetical protein